MPPLTLPPTFANSFWSQDYRTGLQVLYGKLEQGIDENTEIVTFIKARIAAERALAASLTNPPPTGSRDTGFNADDGASLMMAFRGLQAESATQGGIHNAIATDLQEHVADPFESWADQHAQRIYASRSDLVGGWVTDYEYATADVAKLRDAYVNKARKADEAEDDAKFAPGTLSETYTALSPKAKAQHLSPTSPTRRSGTVSERITQTLKGIGSRSSSPTPESQSIFDAGKLDGSNESVSDKADKGKGKEISDSPTALSPAPKQAGLPELSITTAPESTGPPTILLGDLSIPASAISALLFRAQTELPLRTVRFTILGEYENCFSGEELVGWLKDQVPGFDGSLDRAEQAAKDLSERENALRRVGEFGNKFENSPTAYYQFRPKAFNLQPNSPLAPNSPATEEAMPFSPVANNLLKRSNTVVSYLTKTLAPAPAEHPYIKARIEADAADQVYKNAVRKLDQNRLVLEERIEETLKGLQRWETDRLRAVKTVLLQYQGSIASLSAPWQQSNERSSVLVSTFMPESDVGALIERYRTGPFRPSPQVYESIAHDVTDVTFGIDLRKWAAEGAFSRFRSDSVSGISSPDDSATDKSKIPVPVVVTGIFEALDTAYSKMPSDDDRRKIWIYEVPLPAVHHLREQINALPMDSPIPEEVLARYDAPVLASTLKLWALELDPPLGLWEGWDDIRKIYPSVGADSSKDKDVIEELKTALLRLPKVHLAVLDVFITHLKKLVDTTTTNEPNDVYVSKLALSMGRSILRPRTESSMSIQSNHPQLFLADLMTHYSDILPPTIQRKKRESERAVPVRKRTKMVDSRLSRRSIDAKGGIDPRKLLEAEFASKQGRAPSPLPEERRRYEPTNTGPPQPHKMQTNDLNVPSANIHVEPPTPVSLNEPKSPPQATAPPAKFVPPPPPPAVAPHVNKAPGGRPTFVSPPSSPPDHASPLPEFAPIVEDPVPAPAPTVSSPTVRAPPSPRENSPIRRDSGSNLQRAPSTEASRLRGPRVAARGPRPISSAPVNAPPPSTVRPSQVLSSARGRGGSPVPESGRRTPPNPNEYRPTKRGGRAAAGSFSRTSRDAPSGSDDEGR